MVAEPSAAIDADRVLRRMTCRPTSRRQIRWEKAWTELSKEAVWLANVQRHTLLEQVGYRRDAERVRREPRGKPGLLHPPLDHTAHIDGRHGVLGEGLRRPDGGA